MSKTVKSVAEEFITFLNKAVTPFHAVEECAERLESAGFQALNESEPWNIKPLSKYYLTRNRSCIIAFAVGGQYKDGNGNSIIVAHTDSPCLKVKPVSRIRNEGYLQVGVSPYGGGLWRTWFDRDLTVAGRIIYKENGNELKQKLVHIQRPLLHIPNLAIHLEVDREKFVIKKEDHLKPILATALANFNAKGVHEVLQSEDDQSAEKIENKESGDQKSASSGGGRGPDHHTELIKIVAENAQVSPDAITDIELSLVDTQPASLSGLHNEFVSGGRLDNLVGTFTAVTALCDSVDGGGLEADSNIRIAACFDNEECGSQSAQGAMSSWLEWVLRRLHPTQFELSIPRSYMISTDQAHGCHPNYPNRHEANHKVGFHQGIVVKINVNQRYATTALTYSIFKELADKAAVPLQKFVVHNDSPCGSTVGPILSAKLGLQTIDVGTTQFAMHSARELCDTTGIFHARQLYNVFYQGLPDVLSKTDL